MNQGVNLQSVLKQSRDKETKCEMVEAQELGAEGMLNQREVGTILRRAGGRRDGIVRAPTRMTMAAEEAVGQPTTAKKNGKEMIADPEV